MQIWNDKMLMYHECLFARLCSGEGDDSSFSPLSSFHGLKNWKKKTEENTGQNWANEVNKQSGRGEQREKWHTYLGVRDSFEQTKAGELENTEMKF